MILPLAGQVTIFFSPPEGRYLLLPLGGNWLLLCFKGGLLRKEAPDGQLSDSDRRIPKTNWMAKVSLLWLLFLPTPVANLAFLVKEWEKVGKKDRIGQEREKLTGRKTWASIKRKLVC